jgi:hypothetical protein
MRTRYSVTLYVHCMSYYCWNTSFDVHFPTTVPCHGHCDILMVFLVLCATSRKVPGSIPGRVTGDFFRGIRQVHMSGVYSAFRNEYQDIPGGKDGRCVGLTTLPP